ncbi:hypothetical protein OIU85_004049 [Salix viminalis]|uniref:Uncharacterized protein n=1 Tax=Salix viminalis TaxID=40686 RepID=A0A9Q0SXZ5_SALVM|nr:hypothetical protein OIU85_004049 [Salix viminalis]
MEESHTFSAALASNQDIILLHNFEHEITKESTTLKGHAVILPGRCPQGITLQSYTEQGGVRSTQFILHDQVLNRGDNRVAGFPSSSRSARAAADSTSPPPIDLQKCVAKKASTSFKQKRMQKRLKKIQ